MYNSGDSAVLSLLFGRVSIESALETYILYDNMYDKYIVVDTYCICVPKNNKIFYIYPHGRSPNP